MDEPPRRSNNTTHWPVVHHRTPSMSSLTSQESSNDILKLTDKQQAEYRDAYREYIAQMAQLELSGGGGGSGGRPVQPHPGQFLQAIGPEDKTAKEGSDQDGRKSFTKRGSKGSDATDFSSGAEGQPLDPISEEDERLDHSSSFRTPGSKKKGVGPYYNKLPHDDDSGPEEVDNTTPLLHREPGAGDRPPQTNRLLTTPDLLGEPLLDKKDSSDTDMRSSASSSDPSLEDAMREADAMRESDILKPSPVELELEGLVKKRGVLPSSLSGLQDAAVARMSICSEAASETSLMASSPDEGWPPGGDSNLNRTASNATLNNNTSSPSDIIINTNLSRLQRSNAIESSSGDSPPPPVIITPGSSGTAHHNQNLCSTSMGDERESVL